MDTCRKKFLASADQSEGIQSGEIQPTVQDPQPSHTKESQVTDSTTTIVQDPQVSPTEEAQTTGQVEDAELQLKLNTHDHLVLA